jgi:hypothetical protein
MWVDLRDLGARRSAECNFGSSGLLNERSFAGAVFQYRCHASVLIDLSEALANEMHSK